MTAKKVIITDVCDVNTCNAIHNLAEMSGIGYSLLPPNEARNFLKKYGTIAIRVNVQDKEFGFGFGLPNYYNANSYYDGYTRISANGSFRDIAQLFGETLKHTIIIDGKTVEISEESFQALKKSLIN